MDKAKKKRIKRYLSWACMAAVVAVLTVMPLLAKSEAEADGPAASILSARAEYATVETALHGGGTLEAQGEEAVKIPTEVKITEFLVKNGDYVKKGDPLALVDKVSVMTAITGVSDTMEYLREELEDARDEKVDSTIAATPGGRVKKLFAKEGESVQEVMLRDGALAVLSIDGLMAVRLENDGAQVTTGETVIVHFVSGGAEVPGRVESVLDGVKIITVEDQGYAPGEQVTVSREDGQAVGLGTLYIHNAWKATAYSGTIQAVRAKEETTLTAGAALYTLTDRDYTAELQRRANQHREYEQLLQKLLKIYESGVIEAPCEGVISGVEEDSPHLLSANGTYQPEKLSNSGGGYRIVLLSGSSTEFDVDESYTCLMTPECQGPLHNPACPQACTGEEDCQGTNHKDSCILRCTRSPGCPAENHHIDCVTHCGHADAPEKCNAMRHYADCIHSCGNEAKEGLCSGSKNHYLTCIESCTGSDGTKDCPATKTHKTGCIERCSHADIAGVCEGTLHHYIDCIEKCDGTEKCAASKHKTGCFFAGMAFYATAAKVDAVGTTELVVYADASGTAYPVERSASGWVLSGDARLNEALLVTAGTIATDKASIFQKGDIILNVRGYSNDEEKWQDLVLYSRASSAPTTQIPGTGALGGMDISGMMGAMGGMNLSGMIGGFSGFGNYGADSDTQTQSEELYDLEGSTLLTITAQETMTLTITLDEQDISSVREGMEAEVKVDALRGRTFPAQVTKVGTSGTNSGGSSKFTVELTLAAWEDMLCGMSATARLPLNVRENVLTIPVAALTGTGGEAMVYTVLDQETGKPGSPVAVKTGLSDGQKVEILSGLQEGDMVYYSYYDTLELDTSAEAKRFTFG